MITAKAFGALQLPMVRRLVTSPLLRLSTRDNIVTPPSSDSGDKKQEIVKPKPKTHFAAAEARKSDVEIVMNQIEAAIVRPVWSKEQLDSVKVMHCTVDTVFLYHRTGRIVT
jgi:hypothetical protein